MGDPDPIMMRLDKDEMGDGNQNLLEKSGFVPVHQSLDINMWKNPAHDTYLAIYIDDENDTHAVTFTKREDRSVSFYNPTGDTWEDLPEYVRKRINLVPDTRVDTSLEQHQGTRGNCFRHAITRAMLGHMNNAEYNRVIRAAMVKYGLSSDGVVEGITNNTIKFGVKPRDCPQQSLKFGGIVYGRKHNR